MARPLRIEFSGAYYHITARGNAGSTIFLNDDDRHYWLALLGEVCEQFKWRCHAYCQMDNHFHLLIETPEPTLSRGMRQLNGVYTQCFNRRHARCGHVLQGRYHAVIVDERNYALELIRYILLNPVRGGLVDRVDQWRWSSYQSTAGDQAAPLWLAAHEVLRSFDATPALAIVDFRCFVAAGLTVRSPWRELQKNIYLGDADFINAVQQRMTEAHRNDGEIPKPQRSAATLTISTALKQTTDVDATIRELYRSGHYTQKQIAQHLGVHYTTVCRRLKNTSVEMQVQKT